MIITNTNHQVEDNNNLVLLSQFYPPGPITSTGIMAPQQEDSSKPKRRRKRHGADQAGCASHKKRKLTAEQLQFLEMHFEDEQKLEAERKDKLAAELGLDPRQVAVWFQNKRARDKTKKIEESYTSMKTAYENAVTENSRLHSEVAMMREQLSQAEKEVTRLSEMASKNKLPTPFPVEAQTVDSPFADVYSPFSVLDSSFSSVSVDSQFSGSFGCFDWEVSSFGSADGQFPAGSFGSFDYYYYEQAPYVLQNNYASEAEWLLLDMRF